MGIGLYVFFLLIKKNISLRCSKTNDKNTFARDWKAEINNVAKQMIKILLQEIGKQKLIMISIAAHPSPLG